MTHKAEVIDDVTKQMWLIAFFRWFSSVPPTQMTTYDQKKIGMKMDQIGHLWIPYTKNPYWIGGPWINALLFENLNRFGRS